MLTGALPPDTGQIKRADNLRIVLFDQARAHLNQNQTLRQALSPTGDNVLHQSGNQHVVGWAKRFLFRAEQLDMAVRDLSGGEQSRVLIARLMREPADVLILDEPTNDLDIPSLEVLEESLEQFEGALVLVTHDRFMLDRLASEFIGLDGRGGAGTYADLSQWERARDATDGAESPAKSAAKSAVSSAPAKKKLSWTEQRELEQIEAKLLAAETELEQSHVEMNDPAILADHVKLRAACERARLAQEAVDQTYRRWQELEAKRQ
jgi:ABC transport system ATP-binding/permease protein